MGWASPLFLLLLPSATTSYDLTLMGITYQPATVLGAADAVFNPGFLAVVGGASVATVATLELLSAPQGSLDVDAATTLRVGESSFAGGNGRGLFARRDLAAGEVLGTYPGQLIENGPAWRGGKGVRNGGAAADYAWTMARTGAVIDPTDEAGNLCDECTSALGFFSVPTLLCVMNEATDGPSSVRAVEEAEGGGGSLLDQVFSAGGKMEGSQTCVRFVVRRPVAAGEELLLAQYDAARRGRGRRRRRRRRRSGNV